MTPARNLPRPTGPHVGVVVQLREKDRVVSEMNARDNPFKVHRRKKAQQDATARALLTCVKPLLPCLVTLVRIFPKGFRGMDDDNLAGGLKHVRDAVAKWLGVDDGDLDRVAFCCQQFRSDRPGEHAVAIYVEPVEMRITAVPPAKRWWNDDAAAKQAIREMCITGEARVRDPRNLAAYPITSAYQAKLRDLWAEIMDDNLRSVGVSPMPPDASPKRDILEVHREFREVIGKLAATAREITGKPGRAVKSRGGRDG